MLQRTKEQMLKKAGIDNEVLAQVLTTTQLELAFIGELPRLNVDKFLASELPRKSHLFENNEKDIRNIRDIEVDYRWHTGEIHINCRYDVYNEEGEKVKENRYNYTTLDVNSLEDFFIWPSDCCHTYKLEA